MKAVLLHEHGPAEKLTIVTDHPIPEPEPGQVRVRVQAASLNHLDLWVRNGWPGIKLNYPHILGADAAGVIDALGADVQGWKTGSRVGINPTISCGVCQFCRSGRDNMCENFALLGEHTSGTYAEYITVPAQNLIALPDDFTFAEAAAASLVFVTAWHSLIHRAQLRPGETVLVVGAGGGVNTACIQVAKMMGCTVYVVGSTDEKLGQAWELGADVVVRRDIDGGWSRAVYKFTNQHGVDVVVDNVGAATLQDSLRTAARGGRIVTVGNTSGAKIEIDNRYIFSKHLSLLGSSMGTTQDYQTVMNLLFKGKLKAVIGATFPLDQVQEAHRALEAGNVFGKVVLEM